MEHNKLPNPIVYHHGDGTGLRVIYPCDDRNTLNRVVKACNAYPKMVMCLKASLRRLDKYKDAKFIAEAQELLTELEEK